jgi:hypothetical protein
MGLFDRLRPKADKKGPAAKWVDRIEKRVQNYDRQEAIQALSEMGTAEAVEALLKRFTFHMDPSITDQEEKDAAFRGILRAGRTAVHPVRAFAAKAESLAWPMKIMKEILEPGEYVEELLTWLSKWDTEYAKFADPKVQILAELEEHKDARIREQTERFLEDVNETARFHAASTLIAQEDESAVTPLVNALVVEESVRVRTRIAEGLALRAWAIPSDSQDAVRRSLPSPYALDPAGRVKAR